LPAHRILASPRYLVIASRFFKYSIACSFRSPHISIDGMKFPQTDGYSPFRWREHKFSSFRLMHLSPAGLPFGIPGKRELMEI